MTNGAIVTDTFLQSVLAASRSTCEQCTNLISLIEDKAPQFSHTASLDLQLELSQQQKNLYARLAQLRGLNRNAILFVRSTKQQTAEARQEVDMLHLQLQNLYYEEMHLRGEISACESYDHKYQQLPLIPVEEFLQTQPEHADDDERTLMFARINHEFAEREALEQARQGLLKKKQGLIADNKKRKDDLASLDKDLETFIDASSFIPCVSVEAKRLSLGCETNTNAVRKGLLDRCIISLAIIIGRRPAALKDTHTCNFYKEYLIACV